jgi:hypothetical protein
MSFSEGRTHCALKKWHKTFIKLQAASAFTTALSTEESLVDSGLTTLV